MTIRSWLALALLGAATSLHGASYDGQVLVSDSGDRVVVTQRWEPGTSRVPSEPFLTIYDAGGAVIRTLEPADLFTPRDIEALRLDRHSFELTLRLDEGAGEVIAIALGKFATIRIRTWDGTLLDAPRDHLPAPRAYSTATQELGPREPFAASAEDECFDGVSRIASSQLFVRASSRRTRSKAAPCASRARSSSTLKISRRANGKSCSACRAKRPSGSPLSSCRTRPS